MKINAILCFLIAVWVFTGSCGNQQPASPSENTANTSNTATTANALALRAGASTEFDLNLANTVLLYKSYLTQSDDFTTFFKTTSDTFPGIQFETIRLSSIHDVTDTLSPGTTSYFKGLRISYTLDTNLLIRFYYIPVIAELQSSDDTTRRFVFNAVDSSLIYFLDSFPQRVFVNAGGRLVKVADMPSGIDEAKHDYNRFITSIRIFDPEDQTFNAFKEGEDAESCFISIQEIDSVALDNRSDSINVTSSTHRVEDRYNYYVTASAFISSTYGDQNTAGFQNKAGNLTQLCPSRCRFVLVDNNNEIIN